MLLTGQAARRHHGLSRRCGEVWRLACWHGKRPGRRPRGARPSGHFRRLSADVSSPIWRHTVGSIAGSGTSAPMHISPWNTHAKALLQSQRKTNALRWNSKVLLYQQNHFVKIGIAKIFCYNRMFSSINKIFGCCSKIFGCCSKIFGSKNYLLSLILLP